jgi:hypothetical protein
VKRRSKEPGPASTGARPSPNRRVRGDGAQGEPKNHPRASSSADERNGVRPVGSRVRGQRARGGVGGSARKSSISASTSSAAANRSRKVKRNKRAALGLALVGLIALGVYGVPRLFAGSRISPNSPRVPDLSAGLPKVERERASKSLVGMATAFRQLGNPSANCDAVAAEVRRVVGSPAEVAESSGAGSDEGREVILEAVALLRESLTACLGNDRLVQVKAAAEGEALLKRYGVLAGSS